MSSRRHHAIALAWCLLTACGRFGFGDLDSSVDSATRDTPQPIVALSLTPPAFSTTSTTFVDVPSSVLTIPPSPGTRWLVLISAHLTSTMSTGIAVEARYLIDGLERGLGASEVSAVDHPGPWQHMFVADGTAMPQQLSFQLREAQGGMATLSDLSVVAVPMNATDIAYASNDAAMDVTSLTRVPLAPLSLGALQGDYIFMLLANESDLPDMSDVYVEWAGPNNEVWLADTQQPREPWQSVFAMQRATVAGSNIVVTLFGHGGSGTGRVQYARVAAVRADAFASVAFAVDETTQTVTTTPIETLSVNPVAGASQYLFVGSVRLDEPCTITTDADRIITFSIGAPTNHRTDNCAYQTSYGVAGLASQPPSRLSATVVSGNASPIDYYSSQLFVAGLR